MVRRSNDLVDDGNRLLAVQPLAPSGPKGDNDAVQLLFPKTECVGRNPQPVADFLAMAQEAIAEKRDL